MRNEKFSQIKKSGAGTTLFVYPGTLAKLPYLQGCGRLDVGDKLIKPEINIRWTNEPLMNYIKAADKILTLQPDCKVK